MKMINARKSSIKSIIFITLLLSFIVGGLTGGLIGAVTGGLSSQYFLPWIKENILSQKAIERETGERIVKIEEESATIETVKRVSPSVVSIVITKDLSKYYNFTGPEIFPFEDFFGSPFNFKFSFPQKEAPKGENKQQVGGGTGFVISEDGFILTNKHVVADEEADYTVILNDGRKFKAEILARDPILDVAVVKIKVENLPVVELGNSANLQIGQTVIAIGFALGEFRNTVTKGVVSAIGRTVIASGAQGKELLEEAIQTDAAINPGNSGGPLLNLSGQVVGINTAISREGQLIGFAIPIDPVIKIITSVKKYGRVIRPMLGVRYKIITEEIAKTNNLPVDYGALVTRGDKPEEIAVLPGSPADKAGIVENDIVLEINDQKLDEDHNLTKEIAKYEPGDEIELKILSKGKEKRVKAKLEERKL